MTLSLVLFFIVPSQIKYMLTYEPTDGKKVGYDHYWTFSIIKNLKS